MGNPRQHATWIFLVMAAGVLLAPQNGQARNDDRGFIYGRVLTESGTEYTGFLRWDDEEACWDDLFHSSKEDLPYMDEVDRSLRRRHREESRFKVFKWTIRIKDADWSDSRMFIARFGDIVEIEPHGHDEATLQMKSGETYEVGGASNDVGGKIHVKDASLGDLDLRWDRIESIKFQPVPGSADPGVQRLYGKVETDEGTFEGFIQWDKEECLDTDLLDGETEDGDISIPMGRIHSIERRGRKSSLVELKDGRKLRLSGSNDVNSDNRGIMVEDPQYGRLTVGWDAFDRLTFLEGHGSGRGYDDFKGDGWLRGTVTDEDGEEHRGRIVIDLDEAEGWEMLNGSLRDIDFDIPLEMVAELHPLGFDECRVVLVTGKELTLADGQDVSDRNDGVLVYTDGDEEPLYLPWDEVKTIRFQH
jgi:hypothetical protein